MDRLVRGSSARSAVLAVVGLALLALGLTPIQAGAGMVDQKLNGELHGVSALSGTDAWAAGS